MAFEDYLKAIYDLGGGGVKTQNLADTLEVSAASVSGMIKKLSDLNLIRYEKYRGLLLTPAGQKMPLRRHHRFIETYLAEALGYPWYHVHDEAERLEYVISEDFEARIAKALDEPDLALDSEDLTVSYDDKSVLWDIDIDVPPGVLAAIIGPNGAGKNTLLKNVPGLLKPAAGHICLHGQPYAKQRGRVGYVPQRSSVNLDFPTTALDVVTIGLYGQLGWLRRPGKGAWVWALSALEQIGLADFAERQISQLSGEQQ